MSTGYELTDANLANFRERGEKNLGPFDSGDIMLLVASHETALARVAELEAENARLRNEATQRETDLDIAKTIAREAGQCRARVTELEACLRTANAQHSRRVQDLERVLRKFKRDDEWVFDEGHTERSREAAAVLGEPMPPDEDGYELDLDLAPETIEAMLGDAPTASVGETTYRRGQRVTLGSGEGVLKEYRHASGFVLDTRDGEVRVQVLDLPPAWFYAKDVYPLPEPPAPRPETARRIEKGATVKHRNTGQIGEVVHQPKVTVRLKLDNNGSPRWREFEWLASNVEAVPTGSTERGR